jgi:pimeloyl-ACP methyl ester carboxylesterase
MVGSCWLDGVVSEPTQDILHTLAMGDSGPRVAYLHGLFGQGRNWMQIAKAVGGRALLVDLPDHGRSPWSREFSYVDYADRVAETLRAAGGADRWTLVGHSLGGKVAMMVALQHPDLIERLAVVDIAPKGYGNLSRFEGYIDGMRGLPLDKLASRADAEARFAAVESDPGVRAFLLQNLRRDGAGWTWQANLDLFADDADAGEDSRIAGFPEEARSQAPYPGPVLWLIGGESRYVKPEDAEPMRALFPRARLVTVKGADHWVHTAEPAITIESLKALLGKPV